MRPNYLSKVSHLQIPHGDEIENQVVPHLEAAIIQQMHELVSVLRFYEEFDVIFATEPVPDATCEWFHDCVE